VFAEAAEEYGDGAEVEARAGVFDPALFHQRDQVLVDVSVGVDERSIVRQRVTAHLLEDLCK